MGIFIFWVIGVIVVTAWASNWGRSAFAYFLIALLLSPLVGSIILLIDGKSAEKKAQELMEVEELLAESGAKLPTNG